MGESHQKLETLTIQKKKVTKIIKTLYREVAPPQPQNPLAIMHVLIAFSNFSQIFSKYRKEFKTFLVRLKSCL